MLSLGVGVADLPITGTKRTPLVIPAIGDSYFYAPMFAATRPSYGVIAQSTSYNGDYELIGTGAANTKTFSRAGGDPSADAGAGTWYAWVRHTDGTFAFNTVVSRSADIFTLAHPLDKAAEAIGSAHIQNNGQHLSPNGMRAFADRLLSLKRRQVGRRFADFALWHGDNFTNSYSPPFNPQIWQRYGGLANNAINNQATLNIFSGNFIYGSGKTTIQVSTDAAGEGAFLVLPLSGSEQQLQFTCGFPDSTLTARGHVEVLIDGSEVHRADFDSFLSWHDVTISAGGATAEVRIVRDAPASGAFQIRVGETFLFDLTDVSSPDAAVFQPDNKVILIGDSWFDDNPSQYGSALHARFEAYLTGGSVVNEAIGGSRISNWIGQLDGWLAAYRPDRAVLHTGINEHNAGETADQVWQQIEQVFQICRARGVPCLFVMQSVTASQSQMQELAGDAAQIEVEQANRVPKLRAEWVTRATQRELDSSASMVNTRSKDQDGRQVLRVNDDVTVAPDGPAPADTWSPV